MILATKLHLPLPRPQRVLRPHLVKRLNDGLAHKLTLVSAPAGFGKTTLISEWVAGCGRRVAWLSLDEGDSEVTRFLAYLIAALQTVEGELGAGVLRLLRSPQLPPLDVMLGALLNEVTTIPDQFVLILDDYHLIDARPIDDAINFLLKHLPPQMHLVIATREDPSIPLARLRARGELTELRAADLRFTYTETAGFLNQIMGLKLSPEDIAALEARTEGWIAGLQLAALSMQGRSDAAGFIKSFTGSHHFVLDYLIEEVLDQQPAGVQSFLLRTSILDRMCGPLCDAVLQGDGDPNSVPAGAGWETLHYLEHANLFVIPLDDERRWYRYHHLFGDLLRQRLLQSNPGLAGEPRRGVAKYHVRASEWFEENGLEIEAFQHAAAARDIGRAERLMEGNGMPLLFRGAVAPVLNWLASLPATVLDARPGLSAMYASALLFVGQLAGVERKLQAAEAALQDAEQDERSRDLIGHIASIRATLAVTQHEVENIVFQSRRALEYLAPSNLPVRTATTWTLGYAYHLQGERAAAGQAYAEAIAISQSIGHFIINIMATLGLGNLQEADNQLAQAAASYEHVLQLAGDPPLPVACGAHLGLARIHYEWNELDAAHEHAQRGVHLARQLAATDRLVACDLLLARLKLAQGDATGAAEILAAAEQAVQQHNFVQRVPEVGAAQVRVLLHQGNPAAAAQVAQRLGLPISQARVHLARGEAPAALAVLAPLRRQAEAKRWPDERLKVMILQAIALQASGEAEQAVQLLSQALALAEPGGFVRVFVDEGLPLAHLLSTVAARGIMPSYTGRLLAAFAAEAQNHKTESNRSAAATVQTLVEPLSERELEILQLIAQGLSNHEIGERLFIALDTVKGHNRRIFEKLQVQRRTEAVAKARSLNLLPF